MFDENGEGKFLKDFVFGRWMVFYFYLKDNIFGCIIEVKEFSEFIEEFEKFGV